MATRFNFQVQGQLSTTPSSIIYTNASNEPTYFAPSTGADRILFYDDSASSLQWLNLGTNLSISGTTLNATAGAGGYATVQEEGVTVGPGNTTINFIGSGFTAADAGSGVTSITLDATLNSLASYNTNGLLTQTAADTFTGRTLTGTTNRIDITNGNGVSGNPTIDIAATYVGQSSITTVGTITTGTWNATAIGPTYGGTGITTYATGDIPYASASNTLSKLAIGSANDFLKVSGGVPVWDALSTADLSDNANIAMLNENETVSGNWTFSNNVVLNGTPSLSTHGVNKGYVDGLLTGIRRTSVRVATTTAGTLATSFENGDTIDGQTLVTGDRILIKDQATQSENGIYTVNASGAPTRATDMDSVSEIDGTFVMIEDGTQAGQVWYTVSEVTVLGTDPIVFQQLDTTTVTASNGLTKTGNDIALGGSLTGNTTVTAGSNRVIFTGSSSSTTNGVVDVLNTSTGLGLNVSTTNGPGAKITAAGGSTGLDVNADTAGIAILGTTTGTSGIAISGVSNSTNGTGVRGSSSVGTGVYGTSTLGLGGVMNVDPSSTNTTVPVLRLERRTSSTAANDIGAALDTWIEYSDGNYNVASQLITKWSDATAGTRTSRFSINLVNSASTVERLVLSGSGALRLNAYGTGTFTGTPAYNIQVDSSGNLIESAIASTTVVTEAYVESFAGTSIDLDANTGVVKDVDGNNIAFTLPTNLAAFEAYRNGQLIHRSGTSTTRDYSVNVGTNTFTLVDAAVSGETFYFKKIV